MKYNGYFEYENNNRCSYLREIHNISGENVNEILLTDIQSAEPLCLNPTVHENNICNYTVIQMKRISTNLRLPSYPYNSSIIQTDKLPGKSSATFLPRSFVIRDRSDLFRISA